MGVLNSIISKLYSWTIPATEKTVHNQNNIINVKKMYFEWFEWSCEVLLRIVSKRFGKNLVPII